MKFGDLISYPRGLYTHWAVYTGKNEKGEDTSVQFTGVSGSNSKAGATVVQGLLEPGGKVNNQWDGQHTVQSESKMKKTIGEMFHGGAGQYNVLSNNCEQLATKIRYGKPISQQANRVLDTQPNFNKEIAGNMGASCK